MPRFRKRTTQKNIGVGRNCTVFEELRLWAYKWVLEYKRNKASYTQWHSAVFEQAERLNAFAMPLPFGEIKHLVKSVAKWTWRTFTAEKFSAIQSARGKRGGRPKTTTKNGEPWSAMGVSKSTYYRKRKSGELAS